MANYRAVRVGDELKTKISEIIPTLKDPRIEGIVSVTRVEVSNDAKYARVYISALGDEAHLNEILKGFRSSAGYIRRTLAGEELLGLFNFADAPKRVPVDGAHIDLLTETSVSGDLMLPPYGFLWLKKLEISRQNS